MVSEIKNRRKRTWNRISKNKLSEYSKKDCRLSAEEIAVMLGKETKEVELAIKELEKEGILCGYHALVNWDKVDDDTVTALIELK